MGAWYAFCKATGALFECVAYVQERFIVVHRQAEKMGPHWNIKIYYRHGIGCESIVDVDKRVLSTRSFYWERTMQGEIREVEQ